MKNKSGNNNKNQLVILPRGWTRWLLRSLPAWYFCDSAIWSCRTICLTCDQPLVSSCRSHLCSPPLPLPCNSNPVKLFSKYFQCFCLWKRNVLVPPLTSSYYLRVWWLRIVLLLFMGTEKPLCTEKPHKSLVKQPIQGLGFHSKDISFRTEFFLC